VTAARIDPSSLSSPEIDAAVRASLVDGGSLYAVDAELIAELDLDLIVTQISAPSVRYRVPSCRMRVRWGRKCFA
jgi:hypothetical protein